MNNFIEEEITLADLADRFLHLNDFSSTSIWDMSDQLVEVETLNEKTGEKYYVPISKFIVKEKVQDHYTDGKIKVSSNHRFVERGKEIFAKDHPEFYRVEEPIHVVDIEVDSEDHTYLANGRLNHNTTSGGKAVPFASSVRIRLKSLGQITLNVNNVKQVVGIKTRAQVVKNRMGPPFKAIDYDIYFDSGIDDYGSWLSVLKEYNIVSVAGAWYSVKMENPMEVVNPESGEVKSISELKFQSKNFGKLIDANPELKSYLYNLICEKFIMKYRINEDYGVDDVEMVEGYMDED